MTAWLRAGASGVLVLALASCGLPGDEPAARPSPSATSGPASGSPPSASSASGLAPFYGQRLDWKKCDDGFECATAEMPLDYEDPSGETIDLSVVRKPARDEDRRIGSLLVNPGGPGASGVEYARAASFVLSDQLRDRFDIIGFDPRGVGESTPVDCLDDKQTDEFVAADGSPDTAAEERRIGRLSKQFGQLCAKRSGDLLAHVGTRDVARDMDVLRAVLGDEKLHYLGKSYGTFLGATYAELFPDRVGTMVLDGALDPAASSTAVARAQAVGFEVALAAFADDCSGRSDCPLPAGRVEATASLRRLLARIDRHALAAEPGRRLTESLAVLGIVYALYDEGSWPVLRDAIADAERGDGSPLLQLADSYTERGADGRYPNNANDAIYAVNCIDRPETGGIARVRATAAEFSRVAPLFGEYLAWSALPCATWPHPADAPPHPIRAPGAAPILVVGTTRDPATPYAWSRSLADQLESGRLLTYVGDGHTAYRRGSSCIDRAVDRYLVSGRPPAAGTRCT